MAGTVTVKKGDTLSAIAKANKTTVAKIVQANPAITNPNLIKPGQKITLPGATPTKAATPATPSAPAAPVNPAVPPVNPSNASPTVGTQQDSLSMATLEKEWMVTAAVINNNPDLIAAFNKIMGVDANGNKVSGAITDAGLQAQIIQATPWYRNQTDAQRKFDYAKATNPGQFAADLQSNAANIIRQFAANGINITAQEAVGYAQNMMKQSVIVNGKVIKYDQNYLNQLMADSIDFSKTGTVGGTKDPKTGKVTGGTTVYTNLTGNMEKLAQGLYKTAWDYGFPASTSQAGFEEWFQTSLKGLVAGTLTADKLDDMLQQRAISMFPGLANQITQGQTLRVAADPWLQAIANTWEVDANSLDLNNDYVQRALNFQDEKGNVAPMNLYDAKKLARRSSQWDYTQTAKEEKTRIASNILRDFGFLG